MAVMIATSAPDANMHTTEPVTIERIGNHLPVFAHFEQDRIAEIAEVVCDLLSGEDGLDDLCSLIRKNLPEPLFETAYALSCDVN